MLILISMSQVLEKPITPITLKTKVSELTQEHYRYMLYFNSDHLPEILSDKTPFLYVDFWKKIGESLENQGFVKREQKYAEKGFLVYKTTDLGKEVIRAYFAYHNVRRNAASRREFGGKEVGSLIDAKRK